MPVEAAASSVDVVPALEREELLAREMRAFGRECSVAATALCLIGIVALVVVFLGRFRVELDMRGGKPPSLQIVNDGSITRIFAAQQPVDLTSALVLVAAATLAGAMIVFGGTMFHLKKIPPSSAWTLMLTAGVSLIGLLLLLTSI
ncbi:MAG: hypothetical protein IT462_16300 [Planctomycetes bacterium]|nr:hypothetical protein [Planctomycetota bacterium]